MHGITHSSDIPFERDDARRLLPVMVACLVGFATLLICISVSLNHRAAQQSRDAFGVLQIEVPFQREDAPQKLAAIEARLKATQGVQEVRSLPPSEMNALLKPWLGASLPLESLELPTIIDAKTSVVDGKSAVNIATLTTQLQKLVPGTKIEARGPWLKQLAQAGQTLQLLLYGIAALLISCIVVMVLLVARTSLKLHFKTVGLLHMFGATDEYILKQFQWNNALLTARGAVVGAVGAGALYLLLSLLASGWDNPLIPAIHWQWGHMLVLLVMPLFTALVALVATRMTVHQMLRQMH